mmetsp:Transcript_53805/g.80300  ORF Transcript_53805/g.80300 Transcript_53805/m.80300 type:complete len:89 (+) Transcript_53805:129-395(+)
MLLDGCRIIKLTLERRIVIVCIYNEKYNKKEKVTSINAYAVAVVSLTAAAFYANKRAYAENKVEAHYQYFPVNYRCSLFVLLWKPMKF